MSRDTLTGTALVTGGGRGIGAAVARRLARAGMRVAVAARSQPQVRQIAAEIGGVALTGDVTDPGDVARWFDELGRVDLVVNNAAVDLCTYDGEDDLERWRRTIEINVVGPYLCCMAALPAMRAAGSGRIVNVSSGAAFLAGDVPTSLAYAASKAAVCRYSELLAERVRATGVAVFTISPGKVRTNLTEEQGIDDPPFVSADHTAALVHVLASGRADALTGRYIHAVQDDIEDLITRAQDLRDQDRHVVRLR